MKQFGVDIGNEPDFNKMKEEERKRAEEQLAAIREQFSVMVDPKNLGPKVEVPDELVNKLGFAPTSSPAGKSK